MKITLAALAVLACGVCSCRRADGHPSGAAATATAGATDDQTLTTPGGPEPGTGTGTTIEPPVAYPTDPVIK